MMIPMNRVILVTLATFLLLPSKTICHDESLMTSLQSREEYSEEDYSKPIEDHMGEKQRSVNPEELKDWELKNIVKMTGPPVKVVPSSTSNLPLRFGRNLLEKRNIKPAANLPLRFGRASFRSLSRHTLPFPHRLKRSPVVQHSFHAFANLPQRFRRSLLFNFIQDTQDSDQGKNRFEQLYEKGLW